MDPQPLTSTTSWDANGARLGRWTCAVDIRAGGASYPGVRVNTLDFVILLAAAGAAFAGWKAGIAARLVGWIGVALGLVVALRLLPTIAGWFDPEEPGLQFAVASAVVIAGAMIGQGVGQALGAKLQLALPAGPWKIADRSGGLLAGLATVVVAVWLASPPLAETAGWPAEQARESTLAKSVGDALPDPPDLLKEIRETVSSRFPEVFAGGAPDMDVGEVPETDTLSALTTARVMRSTVKVEGGACGHLSQGTGFVVRPGLVMTNAHVVAGMTEPQVAVLNEFGGYGRVAARVVLFDADLDVALLRITDSTIPALEVGDGETGDSVAVFGHPEGSTAVRVAPARIARELDAVGKDLYDTRKTTRRIFTLAADLEPGDSGSAVVDARGRVVGVAFAISTDKEGVAYALTSVGIKVTLARFDDADPAVVRSAGPCAE